MKFKCTDCGYALDGDETNELADCPNCDVGVLSYTEEAEEVTEADDSN